MSQIILNVLCEGQTEDRFAKSVRIIKTLESKHHYDKLKSGELVTGRVGIPLLKEKCKHFKEWIESLEKIA